MTALPMEAVVFPRHTNTISRCLCLFPPPELIRLLSAPAAPPPLLIRYGLFPPPHTPLSFCGQSSDLRDRPDRS